MKYKKLCSMLLISALSMSMLIGCGKKEEEVADNTEIEISTEISTPTPTEVPTPTAEPTPSATPTPTKDNTLLTLQNLQNENKILNQFLTECLKLQEINMLKVYNDISIGDSHKSVMTQLATMGLRYDEEVQMISCYDDSKSIISMGNRTGVVAFDRMYSSLSEESELITSTETSKYYLDLDKKENGTQETKEGESSLSLEEVSETEEVSEENNDSKKSSNPNVPEGAVIVAENSDGSVEIEATPTPTKNYQKLDVDNPVYHSYIAFTFNADNVLVGKFKYLERTEWNPRDLDTDVLMGSLNDKVEDIELNIGTSPSASTVYEKMDEIRERIESNEATISELSLKYVPKFEEFYNSINEETHLKNVKDTCEQTGYVIEKMNQTALSSYNNRFQRNYTEGYYIGLTVDESKDSPDLRYNNVYMAVLFNDDNKMYYKGLVTTDSSVEECKDILDINDFNINDIYENIVNLNAEIEEYESQKTYFTEYIDKNIALFNSKIEFIETKDYILNELEKAGLYYEENYNNMVVTKYRNADNLDVQAFKDNGDTNYDECIYVQGGTKDIYLFFKDGVICGVYRTSYFDVADVVSSTYSNLQTVNSGLNALEKDLDTKKQQLAQYENMLKTRIDSFRNNIGYGYSHKDGQVYTKADVLSSLNLGGFSYDEGMNKMDGLYYIGVRKNPTDLDYSFKIYFNQKEEVETIQDL